MLFPETEVLLEPPGYNNRKAIRANLVFEPTAYVTTQMIVLGKFIIKHVALDPVRFFGEAQVEEVLRDAF